MTLFVSALAVAAAPEEPAIDAASLAHALDRLATPARVLYVAAHPDDENTRLLAYLANARHVTAAYLSMTRGGGGQNLIGREQAELLDVIRTEELLAARRLDGAEQRFTRMRDFGFTKTASEALSIWGRDEALADVVWTIRTFQPDVVITRFDEQPPNHGHHTASAILAREAFTAAADAARFPEQLQRGAAVWKADRLLHNVPQWREGPPPAGAVELDVGAYDVRFGMSYGELAALSRSQHKSQGFGVPGERGALIERFLPLAGTRITRDVFEGLDLTWGRYGTRGAALVRALDEARGALNRDAPERALKALLAAHRAFDALPASEPRVRDGKLALDRIIAGAAGVFVRATAPRPGTVPGGTIAIKVEALARRPAQVALRRVTFPGAVSAEGFPLPQNVKKELTRDVLVPFDAPISTPHFLAEPPLAGRFVVRDVAALAEPLGPAPLRVSAELGIEDRVVRLEVPVLYGWTDRVHGERLRRFMVMPPATVTPARDAVMFPNGRAAPVAIRVRSSTDAMSGEVTLPVPSGWKVSPPSIAVKLAKAGDETTVRFEVTPPPGAGHSVVATPSLNARGHTWSFREDVIDYAHIPLQVVLQPARLKLSPLSIKLPKGLVGYIQGSGDTVAEDLAHVGMRVEAIDDETLRSGDLSRYAAIVAGIRAYNTREVMRSAHARLMAYVEAGGSYVVQYATHSRISPLDIPLGPYPLTIGRDRVTDERAEMKILDPKHQVVTSPNAIGPADFEGWVQERGLYYAEKWDPKYTAIFSAADRGEKPAQGALLVAKHGKGRYAYTGLAFFRQLPAGVPGAYRLFANLIGPR